MASVPRVALFLVLAAAAIEQVRSTSNVTVKETHASGSKAAPAPSPVRPLEESSPAEKLALARKELNDAADKLELEMKKLSDSHPPELSRLLKEFHDNSAKPKDDFDKLLGVIANASAHKDTDAMHKLVTQARQESQKLQDAMRSEKRQELRKLTDAKHKAIARVRELSKSSINLSREALHAARHVESMSRLAKVDEEKREKEFAHSEARFERLHDHIEDIRDRLQESTEQVYERAQDRIEGDFEIHQDEAGDRRDRIQEAKEGHVQAEEGHATTHTHNDLAISKVLSNEAVNAWTVPTPVGRALSNPALWQSMYICCSIFTAVVFYAVAALTLGRNRRSMIRDPPLLG